MRSLAKLFLIACITFCFYAVAQAELTLIGTGANMQADITKFPPEMKSAYAVYKVKCSNPACHRLDRSLTTLKTGVTPSMTVFDEGAIDAYGAKMLRKPDSKMSREDVKIVKKLLRYMLKEAGN